MKQGPRSATDAAKDLVRTASCLWIWAAPGALLLAADATWQAHRLPAPAAGLLFTVSTLSIGIACYVNGRRCGRTHCMIDGYLLPPLGVLGLLNLVGVLSIKWQTYLTIFLLIVIASFVFECCGGKYLGRGTRGPDRSDKSR